MEFEDGTSRACHIAAACTAAGAYALLLLPPIRGDADHNYSGEDYVRLVLPWLLRHAPEGGDSAAAWQLAHRLADNAEVELPAQSATLAFILLQVMMGPAGWAPVRSLTSAAGVRCSKPPARAAGPRLACTNRSPTLPACTLTRPHTGWGAAAHGSELCGGAARAGPGHGADAVRVCTGPQPRGGHVDLLPLRAAGAPAVR